MSNQKHNNRLTRRDFLKMAGGGALLGLLTGTGLEKVVRSAAAAPALQAPVRVDYRMVATDGYISLPGRRIDPRPNGRNWRP